MDKRTAGLPRLVATCVLAGSLALATSTAADQTRLEIRCVEYRHAIDELPRLLEAAFALGGSDPVLVSEYMEWAVADVNVAGFRVAEARNAAGFAPPSDDSQIMSALNAMQSAGERTVSTLNRIAILAAQRDMGEAALALHEATYAAVCSNGE